MNETVDYDAKRAQEYDRVYDFPPWQNDLRWLKTRAPGFFAGRRVFEVACGTGSWTRYFAQSALEIYAIDVNDATLSVARSRDYGNATVRRFRNHQELLVYTELEHFWTVTYAVRG